jgi:ABC-type Fe3+/spermidine/putrescine transport system ATPase subunit
VALARALVYGPPVLLMDEPFGALDRKLRERMQLEIKAIHRRLGITVVFVTHDQEEALTLSDRIAVMRGGRIEQLGPSAELYDRPATRFVAGFLGESNFLEGRVVEHTGQQSVVELDSGLRLRGQGDAFAPGSAVVVAVRPERLSFAEREPVDRESLEGTVEDLVYVGDLTKYRVRVPAAGSILQVQQQNAGGSGRVGRGDAVRLCFSPADLRLLPPGPAA